MAADFRQFYGIDLPVEGDEVPDAVRMAVLWSQLPRESRVMRIHKPSLLWGDSERLLWSIEHSMRVLAWMRTKDAEKGRGFPKPLATPEQTVNNDRRAEAALECRAEIDSILGIKS
ncbi:MAG: hypothetical protein RR218_10615 [Gordonibacter sp.]